MRYRTAQLNAISRSYTEKENKLAKTELINLLGSEEAIQQFKKDNGLKTTSYKVLLNSYKKRNA